MPTLSQTIQRLKETRDASLANELQKLSPFLDAAYRRKLDEEVKGKETQLAYDETMNSAKAYNDTSFVIPDNVKQGGAGAIRQHWQDRQSTMKANAGIEASGYVKQPNENIYQSAEKADALNKATAKKTQTEESYTQRKNRLTPEYLKKLDVALKDPANKDIPAENILSQFENEQSLGVSQDRKLQPGYRSGGASGSKETTSDIFPKGGRGFMYMFYDGKYFKSPVYKKDDKWYYESGKYKGEEVPTNSELWSTQSIAQGIKTKAKKINGVKPSTTGEQPKKETETTDSFDQYKRKQ
jgi:hypothetical protein